MRLPAKVTLLFLWVAAQSALGYGRAAAEAYPERVLADLHLPPGGDLTSDHARRPGDDSTLAVMVELVDEPAAVVYTAERARAPIGGDGKAVGKATIAATRSRLAAIERAQAGVLGALGRLNGKVLYRTQRAYNGIAVQVSSRDLPKIRLLPGVKAVHALVPKQPTNWNSVPFIGAPAAWTKGLGFTGAGIRVGVIDSGIDYLHANFGGPGAAADYHGLDPDNWLTWNSFQFVGDDPNFPGAKVAGGYDFAGDVYNGYGVPFPDADPMDCSGHGSHVAGIIAGYGVQTSGDTFSGPYDAGTPFASLKIGPGVAPGAELYALRVFGCQGFTNLVAQALDWAIDPDGDGDFSDHLNVVNMSLGSGWGGPEDPDVVAADVAVLAGVVVVAPAGNGSDYYYGTASPGVAARAISVAASFDQAAIMGGLRVNAPSSLCGGSNICPATEAAFGPDLASIGDLTGDLAIAAPADGCTAMASLAGKVAVIGRWQCSMQTQVCNAQAAGAVAAVITDWYAEFPTSMPGDPFASCTPNIPAMIITQADGDTIRTAINAGGTVNVTLTAAYREQIHAIQPAVEDTILNISARGPSLGGALKPDITAVGDTVFSTEALSGIEGETMSGTTTSAAHVAGTMALLVQLHPAWTPEELKALAMNTANHDVFVGPGHALPKVGPGRAGAGREDVALAVESNVVTYDDDGSGRVSVSFGTLAVLNTPLVLTRTIRVANKGLLAASYNVAYDNANLPDIPGVTVTTSVPSVFVPGGASATFDVTLTADPAQMKHSRDESFAGGFYRHFVSEEAGYVTLTSTGPGPTLRVPVHAVARPASAMGATASSFDISPGPNTGNLLLTLNGSGLDTGSDFGTGAAFPGQDERSLVSVCELQEVSPELVPGAGADDDADLHYLGVAKTSDGDDVLSFCITTYGDWNRPTPLYIYIDLDRDGLSDFLILGWDGFFSSYVIDLDTGTYLTGLPINGLGPWVRDTVLFNNRVTALTVRASDLGITGSFDWFVRSYDPGTGALADTSEVHTWNFAAPGLNAPGAGGAYSGAPIYEDLPGNTVSVAYDRDAYVAAHSKGLLLLHHHNAGASAAQVVDVKAPPCQTIALGPSEVAVGKVGVSYTQTFTQTGALGPVDFGMWNVSSQSGVPPSGLSFDATTGVLSGTPDQTGSFSLIVTVTDPPNNCRRDRAYTLVVTSAAGAAPVGLAVDTAGNGVLDPADSAVTLVPTWFNNSGGLLVSPNGVLFGASAGFSLGSDVNASYPTMSNQTSASCGVLGCYTTLSAPGPRAGMHWDATCAETLSPPGDSKGWAVHVGGSFADATSANPFYRSVETLLHNGVTAGCGGNGYCPAGPTTRELMAVFLLRSKLGASYSPAAGCSGIFPDVPCAGPSAPMIEDLYLRGITQGCSTDPLLYCPAVAVTRAQMAFYVLRTLEGSAFVPEYCAVKPYDDVETADPSCRWIQEVKNRGISLGCGTGNYCPADPVDRQQVAALLTRTFNLQLYKP